jgi:hypothetical protein
MIQQRKHTYGLGIARLEQRWEYLGALDFPTRGVRESFEDYRRSLAAEVRVLGDCVTRFRKLVEPVEWDDVDSLRTRQAWIAVQQLGNEMIDRSIQIRQLSPPLVLLAAHRQLARVSALAARAIVLALSCLIANSVEAARDRMKGAERTLDDAGCMINRFNTLIRVMTDLVRDARSITAAGGKLSGVDHLAFPELEALRLHDPVMLTPLRRLRLSALLLEDPTRRRRRFDAALRLLEQANASGGSWLGTGEFFSTYTMHSWRQLRAQHERIDKQLRISHGQHQMDEVMDAMTKISEGPFRRYGGLLCVAVSVVTGTVNVFDENAVFQFRKLSTVHSALLLAAPSLTEDIDRLIRNAEAHYDYEVTEATVRIRHFPPNATSPVDAKVDEFSHDDVLEQVLNLIESAQAMAMAVLVHAWRLDVSPLRERFRRDWLAG